MYCYLLTLKILLNLTALFSISQWHCGWYNSMFQLLQGKQLCLTFVSANGIIHVLLYKLEVVFD